MKTNELVGYSRETLRAVLNDRSQTPAMYPEVAEPLARSAGAPARDVAEIVLSD